MIKMATGACLVIEERLESVGELLYGKTEPLEASGHAEDQVLMNDEKVAALAKIGILEQATLNKNRQAGLARSPHPVYFAHLNATGHSKYCEYPLALML